MEDNFQICFKEDGLLAQPHVSPSSCIFKRNMCVGKEKDEVTG
jgi:hypothetical protein